MTLLSSSRKREPILVLAAFRLSSDQAFTETPGQKKDARHWGARQVLGWNAAHGQRGGESVIIARLPWRYRVRGSVTARAALAHRGGPA